MSRDQSDQAAKKKSNPRTIALLGAGASVLAIINMSTGIEAPSTAVLVLQCAALAGGLLALIGGLAMVIMQK